MRGISLALKQRLRRIDSTAIIIPQGRNETAADIRQRYDQWQLLDSIPGNVDLLTDGGVRLKATAANGPINTTITASARSHVDSGATSPYMDPLAFDNFSRLAALVVWTDAEPDNLTQVQASLNPQFDLAQPKSVTHWHCDIYAVLDENNIANSSDLAWQLVPLAMLKAESPAGQAAGFVTFAFDSVSQYLHPKDIRKQVKVGGVLTSRPAHSLVLIYGTDKDGKPAKNVGWGYDGGHSQVTDAALSTLNGWLIRWLAATNDPATGKPMGSPGWVRALGSSSSVPAIKFIMGTLTSATVAFSSGTNDINLGVSTPKASIELVGRGETPEGTSLLYEVRDDAAVWRAFTDGQTLDLITGFASGSYTTLKMRATLTPNSAADHSPILRGLGSTAVAITDFGDVAQVESVAWAMDPLDHHAEIPELRLRALHDGERDFRDAISAWLSQQTIGTLAIRLFVGDRALPKGQWLHLDDFLIEDYDLGADTVLLTGVSSLSLVQAALPIYTSQTEAVPTSDVSNPGVWTQSGGASAGLFAALANPGPAVPWDDTVYILSPVNPANAAYSAGLASIAPPAEVIFGQVLVQFRYALVSGTSLTLKVELMDGAAVKSTTTVTVNSSTVLPGVLTPKPTELQGMSYSSLRIRFTANGTGQIKVTWARLVELPVRVPLVYSNFTPQQAAADLLDAQIALDQRYRGPDMKNIVGLDAAPTILVGTTIDAPAGTVTDPTLAKQVLDALAFVAGGVFHSSQGRVRYTQLYDIVVDPDGTVTYQAKTGVPVAYFQREEICEPISVRPGFQYRVPQYDVAWGFDPSANQYRGVAHGVSQVGLTLRPALIMAQRQAVPAVAQWIPTQELANGLSVRQVRYFGLGDLVWRFTSIEAYPELEFGDVVGVETDRFLAYDPTAARAIAGAQWVLAIIVGVFDEWGRDLAVWVPTYANIGSAAGAPPVIPLRRQDNLILNGDFENFGHDWFITGGVISDADLINGAGTLKVEGPQGAPSIAYQKDEGTGGALYVAVLPNDVLHLKATANAAVSTIVASMRADFYDDTKNFVSPLRSVDVLNWSETTPTTKDGVVVVPAGASFVNFKFIMDPPAGPPATYRAWFDDASCFQGTPLQSNPGTAFGATGRAALVLNKQFSLSTSSTTEVSLGSYVLPADSLDTNGQSIRIHLSGQFKHATGGEIRVKFGATYVVSYLAGAARNWAIDITVTRTGATAQISAAGSVDDAPATFYERQAPAETLSSPVTIDFRGWTNNATQPTTIDALTIEHLAT